MKCKILFTNKTKNCVVCNKTFTIPISKTKGTSGKFCSKKCYYIWYNKTFWKGGCRNYWGKLANKIYGINNRIFICEFCGINDKIVIHHKDKNRKNNDIANLQALCDSCHAWLHYKIRREYEIQRGISRTFGRFTPQLI